MSDAAGRFRCLGIETSCDETAAAVVADGRAILSDVVRSQVDLHTVFGGVVPEVACRAHIETVAPVVKQALQEAGVGWGEIDAVAVTYAPGLVGALLVGVSIAKAVALAARKPLIGVDHIHGHIYANRFSFPDLAYPCLSLVVSGGHTSLYHSRTEIDHDLVGATVDDAAGEAFDKAAKILGLGFPGGPAIDRAARGRDPGKVRFKRTLPGSLDFSFSGIKTAVLYAVRGQDAQSPRALSDDDRADIAAGFQEAVVDMLIRRTLDAADRFGVDRVAVGGGVACNSRLREKMREACALRGIETYFPPPRFCTDNAAMIAGIAYPLWKAGRVSDLTLDAVPTKGSRK